MTFEQYDWLDMGDDELPEDYETLCFELMPNINTYNEMYDFAYLTGCDQTSWFTLYRSLLTIWHFGTDYLEKTYTDADSIIEAQIMQNTSLAIIDGHNLTLIEHEGDIIEVYDRSHNKLGNVILIAGLWLNDRFDDFPDMYSAAVSYIQPVYQDFGW
jgi:hypothetical protein